MQHLDLAHLETHSRFQVWDPTRGLFLDHGRQLCGSSLALPNEICAMITFISAGKVLNMECSMSMWLGQLGPFQMAK